MKNTIILWACAILSPHTQALVLQIEISHPQNVDQESLIFKKDRVEFVTNVFHSNKGSPQPRLGQFSHPYNNVLNLLKRQVLAYRKMIDNRNKRSATPAMIAEIQQKTGHTLTRQHHRAVIRIAQSGENIEIEHSHPHFTLLADIFRETKKMSWSCLSCAEYKKEGSHILRIVKRKNRVLTSKKFSPDKLKCYRNKRKDNAVMECIDHQFGIFKI